jgi:GNAT superfamily N-acetyltransferase
MERLALRAWPALEEVDYDGWRLRAARGYTGRANSVAPLAHGGLPLAEKIAHVEDWYAARRLPAKFRLTEFSRPGNLDPLLATLGYRSVDSVATMTLALSGRRRASPPDAVVELSLDEWSAGTHVVQRAILERIQPTRWLLGWRADGVLAGRVMGVLEDGWVGVFNLSVLESHRRRGIGRGLVTALLDRAATHSAGGAYLQVVEGNPTALALYVGLDFSMAYRYWYRVKETQAPSLSH